MKAIFYSGDQSCLWSFEPSCVNWVSQHCKILKFMVYDLQSISASTVLNVNIWDIYFNKYMKHIFELRVKDQNKNGRKILHRYITDSIHDQLPVGLIGQLVEHRTGIAEVMSSNPVQAWIFFRFSFRNCLSCILTARIFLPFDSTVLWVLWTLLIFPS